MEEKELKTVAKQRDSSGRFVKGNDTGWQPGQSGNPKGAPKKEISLTAEAKAQMLADPSIVVQMAKNWLKQAKAGKTDARRDLQDRTEGKSPNVLEVSGPITIRVVREDAA